MNTPIYDFVTEYLEKNMSRMHMPGHKGKSVLGCEMRDITEILGADALYEADGIIAESEKNASELFGTKRTFFSAEGSSQCIKAMVFMALQASKGKTVIAGRNAHKSFVHACALADADVKWIYSGKGEDELCSCHISPYQVKKALEESGENAVAVYITTPDYLGNQLDIAGIALVCREYSVPLLVDNAHGAYLKFLPESQHPMDLGAAMCCDSAHKTLPVLTGGAYLHIAKSADDYFAENGKSAMSIFGSTSPSYLILQSLDLCNKYLASGYIERILKCVKDVERVKAKLCDIGIPIENTEKLKIVINAAKIGYTGGEIGEILRRSGIEPEFEDLNYTVVMVTPETEKDDLNKLFDALCACKPHLAKNSGKISLSRLKAEMSIREAVFSRRETVTVSESVGRICGNVTVACPPAVPIAVSGERIDENAAEIMKMYGVEKIEVVKREIK